MDIDMDLVIATRLFCAVQAELQKARLVKPILDVMQELTWRSDEERETVTVTLWDGEEKAWQLTFMFISVHEIWMVKR